MSERESFEQRSPKTCIYKDFIGRGWFNTHNVASDPQSFLMTCCPIKSPSFGRLANLSLHPAPQSHGPRDGGLHDAISSQSDAEL